MNDLSDPRQTMHFLSFEDYFFYEGIFYLAVHVAKYGTCNAQDCFLQSRYINPETGEFLPFTKKYANTPQTHIVLMKNV
jgi:hypothetical protein